jgi:hypothetical protein
MPSILSTLAFGRSTVGGGTQGIQLFIANVNRTSYLGMDGCRLDKQTKGRSKMSLRLEVHDDSGYVPTIGNPVILLENGDRKFGGFIVDYRQQRHMTTDHNFVFDVSCSDWAAICDHRIVSQQYGAGEFGYAIMRDIAENFLDGENITTNGTFGITQTTERLEFVGSTVTEAFDRICDLTGMTWWIDPYKDLHTTSIALATAAPFNLSAAGTNWRNLSVRVTARDYRNVQYIKSNRNILVNTRSETFTSDGLNSWFLVTRFGLTEPPVVLVNGVAQTIFELGVDPYNQAGWYWLRDGYGVQQGMQTAPAAGSTIEVQYGSFASNYTRTEDDEDEIAARAAIEGGSGKWEAVTDINEVANEAEALMHAEALKRRSGSMLKEIEYETDYKGLEPGMRQTIEIPNDGLSGTFIITQVTSRAMGLNADLGDGSSFRHTVRASISRTRGTGRSFGSGWSKKPSRARSPKKKTRTSRRKPNRTPGAFTLTRNATAGCTSTAWKSLKAISAPSMSCFRCGIATKPRATPPTPTFASRKPFSRSMRRCSTRMSEPHGKPRSSCRKPR